MRDNTIYANLGKSNAEVSGIEIEPSVNEIWQGAGGLYRPGIWVLTDASSKNTPSVTVDTYFGARYTYLDLRLDTKYLEEDLRVVGAVMLNAADSEQN